MPAARGRASSAAAAPPAAPDVRPARSALAPPGGAGLAVGDRLTTTPASPCRLATCRTRLCCIQRARRAPFLAIVNGVPRGQPLDRDFVAALRLLDAVDTPYAEMWRKLAPVAAALGRPRPSYSCVRAFLIVERTRRIARMALVDVFLDDAFAMRGPLRFLTALVEYNTSSGAVASGRRARRPRGRPGR
jgi:hypothetical protein